jgi:hypothetical protein
VRSRLDEIVPRWQFAERHATRVRAAPAAVERAVRSVTAREIGLFRLLTWIRNPRLPGSAAPASILAAPPDEAILDVALRSGFVQLAASPDELVFGTIVVAPPGARSPLPAARYRDLVEPGWAKAVMNFRWYDDGAGWTRLETETRVFATDAASRRRFALYWRTIYPGSSLIRRTWLAAIRRRAEADATR